MSRTGSASPPLWRGAPWRKSSYSGGNDDCIEVADIAPHVAVRDSKEPDSGPALFIHHAAWDHFIAAVAKGSMR